MALPEKLALTAEQITALLAKAMPVTANVGTEIQALAVGSTTVRMPYQEWMFRPGGTVSGPAMMTAADTAMYVMILGMLGPKLLAVTSDMNIRFLRKPQAVALIAKGSVLRLGRRSVVCSVDLFSEGDPQMVAQVTGNYALP